MSEKVFLQRDFRVWCQNKVSEYRVSLTLSGLSLEPLTNGGGSNSKALCCKFCCSIPYLEILGSDIVSCRPATGLALNTKFNLGPPIFMLITFPVWSKKPCSRYALYFHYISTNNETENINESFIEDDQMKLMRKIMKIKEEWVGTIYEIFLPWKISELNKYGGDSFPNRSRIPQSLNFLSQKLLVVMNPNAGYGNAQKLFKDNVMSIFNDAKVSYEVMTTKHEGHIYKVMRMENLARWRGVVVVGGDGTLSEVLNGLFDRDDWQDALAHLAVCSIPVGGGRNAFARSMCQIQGELDFNECSIISGAVNAARSRIRSMDLFFVQTKKVNKVGLANISWGSLNSMTMPSNFSSKSALINKISLRRMLQVSSIQKYSAVLSYLPVKSDEKKSFTQIPVNFGSDLSSMSSESSKKSNSDVHTPSENVSLNSYCSSCSKHRIRKSRTTNLENVEQSNSSNIEEVKIRNQNLSLQQPFKYTYTSLLTEGQLYFRSWQELEHTTKSKKIINTKIKIPQRNLSIDSQKRPKPFFPSMPNLPRPLPKDAGWKMEVGTFISIHLLNHSFLDHRRLIAPESLPDDGILWLLLIRAGISRKDLFKFMTFVESSLAENFPDPLPYGIELIPVRGIRLAPLSEESAIMVDGNKLDCDCIQAFVMPGAARTLVK